MAFQLDLPKFEAANAQVLGVSVDFIAANIAFAERLGLKFPLLSDTRRVMSRAYGVLNDDPAAANDEKRIAVDRCSNVRLLKKELYMSQHSIGRNQRHLHGVVFASFSSFFIFRSLSGASPTNSWQEEV